MAEFPKAPDAGGESVVRKGGIASEADADDVSRDTYGFTGSGNAGSDMSPEDARERLDELLPVEDDQERGGER